MTRSRTNFMLIVVLFLTTLACNSLFPNLPQNTVPDAEIEVVRKDGECKDPRFKEAELAAFRTLLQERAAATTAFDKAISTIEEKYKAAQQKKRSDYDKALNACKDATCSLNAKTDYDTYVEREQISQEAEIQIAEDAEQTAIEQAQEKYNKAVDQARRQFCTQAYKISSTHRWAGDGYTATATMEDATLMADDQGNFTGQGTLTWVSTLVPPEDCSIFTGSYAPSQTDMTAQMDKNGQLAVQLNFQPVQYSGTEYCAIGNFVRSDDSWTVTETLQTLKFSVPAEGGTVPLSQELFGQRSSATGEAVIIVTRVED
jgi:hypothetical protein